jgi:3-oxoacyl-ACP reductase-like protein
MRNYVKLFGIIAMTALIVFSTAACNKGAASSAPSASSASASSNIDSLLNEYEKYIDEFAPLMQRVLSGDAAAAAEAQKYEAQLTEWAEKIERLPVKDFTPAQNSRMEELNLKLIKGLGL